MKRIYLFRHSTPDKSSKLQNEYIPLSQEGPKFARQLVDKLAVAPPVKVFSSPYIRAKQTAEAFSFNVITDARLIERKTGNEAAFTNDLWAAQYADMDAKNDDGESFRMVRQRMSEFMNGLLAEMNDGEYAFVVSHAAAICAYLQQYCEIRVTDIDTKCRRIVLNNKTVLDGKINTPSCFILTFNNVLTSVAYID